MPQAGATADMSCPPSLRPALLGQVLRTVARPYRVAAMATASAETLEANPATMLAVAIDRARAAQAQGDAPDTAQQHLFVQALSRLIRDAMRAERGDPAFQAMVLRHRVAHVREYASLSAHADSDRRRVRSIVDAVAHPGKGRATAPLPAPLTRLHEFASSASWTALAAAARQLTLATDTVPDARLQRGLGRLLDNPALQRLQRLEALASDDLVRQHRALLDRNGPRAGSAAAVEQGRTTQQRGAAVEASAAQALHMLARRLNAAQAADAYRVVTSMCVPASIPGSADRAKTEWDAVLLRRAAPIARMPGPVAQTADGCGTASAAGNADAGAEWDVCLLVEAKASIDAAATDFPRLLRGLRLLAGADANTLYPFTTQQGVVCLRGASLRTLDADTDADADDIGTPVLYCCDVPADAAPRLLSAASRMQLLSAPASLEYASRLARNQPVDALQLAPVWQALLSSPRWHAVLHQYQTLRRARALMVHVADLAAAIDALPVDP